jgi:hypothetical protein
MINLVIFYFLSMITLLFYPLQTIQAIFYSLMIVYIYKKCNIENYKSMSFIFLKLLVILFYLLDTRIIIAGIILLLLVVMYITTIFNNNILAKCDNNYMVNMVWKGCRFIISLLNYLFAPIYKYFDIGINKLINYLTSPKSNNGIGNKEVNELEKLELIFKNINEQIPSTSTNPALGPNFKPNLSTKINKMGSINNFKLKNNKNNIDKQTKDLINMFEQLSNILQQSQ